MISTDVQKTLALGIIALALLGCSSAQPTDDPGIDRLGRYLLINQGPEAEVAVGYRYAAQNLGSQWLLLEVAVTSPPGQTARIKREAISVTTPTGSTIPLATQREFNEAYSSLQGVLRAADVMRDPMDYWPPRKEDFPMKFFVQPGQGVAFDEFSVNDFRTAQGRFLFEIPGGVQAGRHVLDIDLEESEVRIPFTLED
jgi:hypothetical protein